MSGLLGLIGRYAVPLILGLIVLLALMLAVAAWNGAGKRAAGRDAAAARGGQVVAQAGEKASRAAVEAVAGQGEKEAAVAVTDQENEREILSQPDAGAGAGAAGDAGLRGLCKRAVYRNDPRCARLRRADSAPASR